MTVRVVIEREDCTGAGSQIAGFNDASSIKSDQSTRLHLRGNAQGVGQSE